MATDETNRHGSDQSYTGLQTCAAWKQATSPQRREDSAALRRAEVEKERCGRKAPRPSALPPRLCGEAFSLTQLKVAVIGFIRRHPWPFFFIQPYIFITIFKATTKEESMPVRNAEAEWKGNLAAGSGRIKLGSGAFEGSYSFKARFEEGQADTNPEELIGAAHAGCFTMALTAQLSRAGFTPARIQTTAKVKLDKVGEGFAITRIDLATEAEIPNIDDAAFQKHALDAKENCPVSKALAGTEIHLNAKLLQ